MMGEVGASGVSAICPHTAVPENGRTRGKMVSAAGSRSTLVGKNGTQKGHIQREYRLHIDSPVR